MAVTPKLLPFSLSTFNFKLLSFTPNFISYQLSFIFYLFNFLDFQNLLLKIEYQSGQLFY